VLPFNYLTPVFSLSVAALVLGEPITVPVALGGVCVIAGVALSQLPDVRRLLRARRRTGAAHASTSSSRPA
jgi:O-acetylserine/cysteine efflux transporter